jgi:hypothetical protein
MATSKKKNKGLSDSELIEKYEAGKVNFSKALKSMLKTPALQLKKNK